MFQFPVFQRAAHLRRSNRPKAENVYTTKLDTLRSAIISSLISVMSAVHNDNPQTCQGFLSSASNQLLTVGESSELLLLATVNQLLLFTFVIYNFVPKYGSVNRQIMNLTPLNLRNSCPSRWPFWCPYIVQLFLSNKFTCLLISKLDSIHNDKQTHCIFVGDQDNQMIISTNAVRVLGAIATNLSDFEVILWL